MSRTYFDPDFEPRVADWLEADPDLAPAPVLSTVLAAFPSIPQRRVSRVPWRFQTMNRFALFGAAAAIVVAVGLGGLAWSNRNAVPDVGAGPTASPTPRPSPSSTPGASPEASGPQGFTETHASDLYAYRLRYPATWNLGPGKLANTSDNVPELADGAGDFFGDTMSGHGLFVTSAPVSAGRTDLATWSAFIADAVPSKFGTYMDISKCEQSTRALTLDGEPANEVDFICPNHDWLWVTAVHGGRAYQIAWLDDGGFDQDYLRPFLDLFLQTFTFTD